VPSFVGQAILQTLVAGLVVEALLRVWRIAEPGARLAFRLLVLLVPFVVLPALLLLAPWRASDVFTEQHALFFGGHWAAVRLAGVGLDRLGEGALAVLGAALYLVDLIPFLADRASLGEGHRLLESPRPLEEQVRQIAEAMRVRPPRAIVADWPFPLLFCSGLRPALVVSRATLDALDEDELGAALAHEVAHAGYHDPARGWFLMLARTVMCFNPVVQLVARGMVHDMERRADLAAAAATGNPAAMARALSKLGDIEHGVASHEIGRPSGILARLRSHAVTKRREALVAEAPPVPTSWLPFRLAIAAIALPWLLFHVI
jgi:Zn-dependent protease with chaperone function